MDDENGKNGTTEKLGLFFIFNVFQQEWIIKKDMDIINAQIDDSDFIQKCKDEFYTLYDGMKIKALFTEVEEKILIKEVKLVG